MTNRTHPSVLKLRRARKALRTALLVIENDARIRDIIIPGSGNDLLRWCDELRVESGCDKPKNQ